MLVGARRPRDGPRGPALALVPEPEPLGGRLLQDLDVGLLLALVQGGPGLVRLLLLLHG